MPPRRQSARRIVNRCRILPRGEGRTLTRCRVTIPAGLGQERPAVVARKREFMQLSPLVEMPDSFSTLLRGPSVPRPFPSLRPVFSGPIQHALSPRPALCPLALVRLRLSSGTPSDVPLCIIYTTSHQCHPARLLLVAKKQRPYDVATQERRGLCHHGPHEKSTRVHVSVKDRGQEKRRGPLLALKFHADHFARPNSGRRHLTKSTCLPDRSANLT